MRSDSPWRPSHARPASWVTGASRALLLNLIALYRRFVSPALPPSCRFYPSCSLYAEQAITRYGPWRGTSLALKRLSRCHPWNPGGYDPVP
ncbi:MAG: membrane protein insertion efficiency factor YidD [Anaerolineae bacterium]|nr:membrane protein insertion efficiency factor YidD [Anaerolineae bacterium]